MSEPITVAALAAELDTTVRDVAHRVTQLCAEYGAATVVHTPDGMSSTVLHPDAADTIRAEYRALTHH